ncbi:DUF1194 domain-containing protein [Methylopila sp. 73B]|uniref:DUF1194 domain-containing protein n=1 Tax=Methylopila sp. 73B TaxID=1120792 RepID=UPI000377606F|nr:DUF1194 domain-containing protein [Methylopila sp. 73B]
MGAIAAHALRASIRIVLPLAALAGSAAFAAQPAETDVDLELVLAVDISYSMDTEEQQVQREGYGAAIVSKPVLDAIRDGMLGRIAVTYVEWAGSEEQATIVPWRIIDGPESAQAFAAALAAQPLRRAYRTSISGALAYAARAFEASGARGLRKVIDVSGDGPNNQGEMVERVRDEVLERGVVINGLPLMLKRPSAAMMDLGDLDAYYRDCVIGGPGAFVLPVRSVDQFPDAVRTKLVMEIAGLPPATPELPAEPRPTPAAGLAGPSSCTVGEQLWRDRFGN